MRPFPVSTTRPSGATKRSRLPTRVIVVPKSSCCGMAGSFGYEARHHEVSMQMAEAALLPAIRKMFNLPAGDSLLAAIIVLAVMILPSIISVSENALKAVPKDYEEASLALGATEIETYFRVSVPAAKSGIAAAVVLGIGRAIGEAMAILMVAGNVANMPSLFKSVKFLTTAVASEMSYSSGLQRQALFSIGLVLFLFIMLINIFLNAVLKREKGG